jgi:hypothetical protein
MAIVYRTDGAWGTGKGSNLAPAEVDGNFYDLDGRITNFEDNPPLPIEPISITITGYDFSMGLSNGETLGPVTMTMPVPQWRGVWTPNTLYNDLDFITAPPPPDGDGGFGAVMMTHTSGSTFSWAATGASDLPLYREIVGGTGMTVGMADLTDVSLTGTATGHMLVYNAGSGYWVNQTPAQVAANFANFTGDTGSGGTRGMVPAPAAGDAAANKVLGAGGGWVTVTSTGGGSSSLAALTDVNVVSPANNELLQFKSSDGKWHNAPITAIGGTVQTVNSGTGLAGGPITVSGTLSLAAVSPNQLLANVSGTTAAPTPQTLSAVLDAMAGSTRGNVLHRTATGWTVLAPGTAGEFLRSGGSGNDVSWGSPSGNGTVTSVAAGAGLAASPSPITGAGTLSLAAIGDQQVLANISGGSAPASGHSLSTILDDIFGALRGNVLFRGATGWQALAAGTSGQVLTTYGSGADPAWSTAAGGGAKVTISDSPPTVPTPLAGDLWWASDTGQLFVYYNDGTSSQFVQANSLVAGAPGGDVSGPAVAVSGNLASYSGTTGKVIADSGLAVSNIATIDQAKTEFFSFAVSDETTNLTTGTAKLTFRMPFAFTLSAVRASLSTASSSGLVTIDINENGISVFSTGLTIDATEKTSTTAAVAAVISDSSLADDAEMTIDIDAAGTGARGLKVTLIGVRA